VPGGIEPASDAAEDVAPTDSTADDAQPDDSTTIAPQPITASPTSVLAPGLAALIDGVMAARESQLTSDPGVEALDEPVAEAAVELSDEPAIEPAPAPESTPGPSEDPPGLTNADVEQTATAMRDASLPEDGIDVNADEEAIHAGGGLPFANSNSPGAESALYAAGLLALLVVAKRPRKKDDS
jgi:hypothetical protein